MVSLLLSFPHKLKVQPPKKARVLALLPHSPLILPLVTRVHRHATRPFLLLSSLAGDELANLHFIEKYGKISQMVKIGP